MIKPLSNKIQLDIQDEKIGAIQSESIQEKGTIIAIGPLVAEKYRFPIDGKSEINITTNAFTVGATLYFKAWAIDIITEGDKKYYFISSDSDAICAISQ